MDLLTISSEIQTTFPKIRIGVALIQDVSITKRSVDLSQEKNTCLKQFNTRFTLRSFLNHHLTIAYRNFYRKIGLNPKITPPGPQNLISRYFKENIFSTINTLVDACNLAVFLSLIPLGIFDAQKIIGTLHLRFSTSVDKIIPIGLQSPQPVPENVPIFVDDNRVISAPIYHRDSNFSKIQLTTNNILLMAVAVDGVTTKELKFGLDSGIVLIKKYNGGYCNNLTFLP